MATLYFNGAIDNDWNTIGSYATGSASFSDQPADADTLTINSVVFEFDNDSSVTGGNISVAIGTDLATTLLTLESLIESNVSVAVVIDGSSLNLTANSIGPSGNYSMSTTSSVITTDNMSGGNANWWTDSGFTTPATVLPTSSDDVVVSASANVWSNSGSEPTVANLTHDAASNFCISITVTGLATFNSGAIFTTSTITGDCEFYGSSYNVGAIDGTVNFYEYSSNGSSSLSGNVLGPSTTFHDNSRNFGDLFVFTNTVVFNDSSSNLKLDSVYDGGSSPSVVFNDDSSNGRYISGNNNIGEIKHNAIFNDTSYNYTGSTITGNATFTGNDYSNIGRYYLNPVGIVNGTVTFSSLTPVVFTLDGTYQEWTADTTSWIFDTPGQNWKFDNGAICDANIVGNVLFDHGSKLNNSSGKTITGNVTFDNNSYVNDPGCNIIGNVFFDNGSYAKGGAITGNVIFDRASYNIGSINVDENVIFNSGTSNGDGTINGTVTGIVTFDGGTNSSTGTVIVPVDEECSFTNSSINYGIINGTATFDSSSYNSSSDGYVDGLAKFYLNSRNDGEVESAEFYSNSYNVGTVNGDATFNDESKNGYPADMDNAIGMVIGTATFNDSSQNGFLTNGQFDVTFGRCGNMVMRGQSKNLNGVVGSVTLDYPKGINGSSILGIV